MNARTLRDVEKEIGEAFLHAEVLVPLLFQGTTTKLVASVARSSDLELADIAKSLLDMTEEWNKSVRKKYREWVSVKDTTMGPIWLEGIDEKHGVVSFGYLEHITERLLLGNSSNSNKSVSLRTCLETICDIREKKKSMSRDEIELVRELFKSVDEHFSAEKISVKDIARYILSGGFSSHFRTESPRHFLAGTAESRGYWSTLIVCRLKKMQIRFTNANGEIRIAQRKSTLDTYAGIGFVHPSDAHAVHSVSEPCHDNQNLHFMRLYWKDMDRDTTTREELCKKFPNSIRTDSADRMILGVDMTIGESGTGEQQLIPADNTTEFNASFSETEDICNGSYSEAHWRTARQLAELDNYLATPNFEELINEAHDAQRDALETMQLVKDIRSGKETISDSEMERLIREAQDDASQAEQSLHKLQAEMEQEDAYKKVKDILRST